MKSLFAKLFGSSARSPRRTTPSVPRLEVETLEGRSLPSRFSIASTMTAALHPRPGIGQILQANYTQMPSLQTIIAQALAARHK